MMYDVHVIELSVTLAGWNSIFLGILTLSFCLQVENEAGTIVGFSPCFDSQPVLPFTTQLE